MKLAFPQIISIPAVYLTDWQTYRNEEYGFEIKYPTNWQMASDFPGRLMSEQTEREEGVNPKSFNFAPLTKDLRISQDGDVVLYTAPSVFDCSNYTSLNNENIADFLEQNIGQKEIEFCGSNKYFRFNLKGAQEEIYNQMLSTFRFTK